MSCPTVAIPSPADAALLASIREIVGPAGLVSDDDMQRYVVGARYGAGQALCVARPGSAQEVAALVALCAARGIRLVPQGANTGLVGASTPDESGQQLVLSLNRLRGRCEVDVVNRTVDVDAGVLLHELNDKLEPHGLCFPIDLGADPSIGGMIAANTGGARLLRYGDVRHNLLAIEAVLFDPPGKLVRLGAPLRKNNTGFDLMQLFVGTGGAAGVITGATLEVARRPAQSATALVVPASDEAVSALLLAAETRLGDFLCAFEGISDNAVDAALRHVPSLRNPFGSAPMPPFALLIEVASTMSASDSCVDVEQLLVDFLEQRIGEEITDAVVGKGEELWQLRHSLSEGARALGKVVGFDVSVRRSDVMRLRRQARELVASRYPEVVVVDYGHVGDGGLHFNVVWRTTGPGGYEAQRAEQLRDDLYALVVGEFGGSYSAEHGVGPHNHAYYLKYTPEPVLDLSGRLQTLLDPAAMGGRVRFGKH